jgi:magnesium transporter
VLKQYKICDGKLAECAEPEVPIYTFICPDKDEKTMLLERFKVDEHTMNSALDPDEVSRIEFEPDHTALILKRPKNYSSDDNLLYRITSIGIFLYKDALVVIMSEDIPLLEGKLNAKIASVNDAFLRIISGIINHFLAHLKVINMLSESIEQKINASMENKYLINMFTLEKSLVYYLNGISSNITVIEKIRVHAPKIQLSPDNLELLDDIIIENNQCYKQAEIYSNILTGLMDARGSIVNNNLNILIKRLTVLSIVFMPLNVIAGMGGMSEFSMMTQGIDWRIAYGLFSAAMFGIAFFTYLIIRNMGFEKREKVKRPRKIRMKSPSKAS